MITCDYSCIAKYYDQWSMGDYAYDRAAKFYLDYLSNYNGVFAELGVGTGRIAVPFSRRNDALVYGIDSCDAMLEECRNKIDHRSNLTLINADFTNFTLPRKADIIYMPFRTIGHILERRELEALFQAVHNNLKQNGEFVFDHYMFSRSWALNHNNIELPMYEDREIIIVDRYIYDFDNNLMHCQVECNSRITADFDFRWIEVSEIHEIYPIFGFSLLALYGDFDRSEWTPESPNQIWVLRRTC